MSGPPATASPAGETAAFAGGQAGVASLSSWIEICEQAYAHNLRFFRRLIGPRVELAVVVKANAYGHGWRAIAELAIRHGADSFCVHSLEEALQLRQAGFRQDVLIMGHVPLGRLAEAVAQEFRLVLYNLESAERLAQIAAAGGPSPRVHMKLETGTCRQGIEGEELETLLAFLGRHPSLRLEGAYTHFANIEDTTRHDYAEQQLKLFARLLERVEAVRTSSEPFLRHAACSAATLLFPETYFDMVRIGVSQFGYWPSKETFLSFRLEQRLPDFDEKALRPVLTWKARISQIKTIPAGSFIGYGCTYQATRETRLAVLPTGYSDGYDRRLSNQAYVLIHGRRAPVRGRVCMNLTMVDVTDIPDVVLEDEVVLLGRQGDQEISAEHLAGLIGTIAYEVVARLRSGIPRLVV